MRARGSILAAAVLILLGTGAGPAGRAQEPVAVLSGIDRVWVRCDYLSEMVSDSGMKKNDLLIQLADRVREAGLLVLSADSTEASGPLLVLTLESVEMPSGDLALHGALELREQVTPARLPGLFVLGSTWYASMLTVSPREGVADESRNVVAGLADQFTRDLLGPATP